MVLSPASVSPVSQVTYTCDHRRFFLGRALDARYAKADASAACCRCEVVKNAFDAAEADEEAKAQQQARGARVGVKEHGLQPACQVQNQATMAADLRTMFQAIAVAHSQLYPSL